MNRVELDDVFSETWQGCAPLVERQIKVEQSENGSLEGKETSLLSPNSTASNESSVLSSIENNELQPQLVMFIEGLPIKSEGNISADQLTEGSLDSDDYVIKEFKNEANFSFKSHIKSEPITSESKAGYPLNTLQNSKYSGDTIKEESLDEMQFLNYEELDIKSENEEDDQSNIGPAEVECEKRQPISNKIAVSGSRHPDLVERSVFKCFHCSYQTFERRCIINHVRKHMEMTFKCSHCPYKTWQNTRLKYHQLVHVPKEEREFHKCPKCDFTSKWLRSLRNHLLVHKSLDEITWHQCPECPFKTKHKDSLTRSHMLRHRKDVVKHKCTLCPYEALLKLSLQRHIRCIHKPEGVEVIKCPEEGCLFKTYDKSYLAAHIRFNHKSNNIFKCLKCSYQSKNVCNFKVHKLVHKDRSKWLSCTLCAYKTPRRNALNRHALVHKSDSEVKWFYCSECSYKSKRKAGLKHHKLLHNQVLDKYVNLLVKKNRTFVICVNTQHESVELDGVLSESRENCAPLVERQIKVEQSKNGSLEGKETSVLSSNSTASNESSVLSSIENNKFQPQLVMFIEGLPIKPADQLTECSFDSDDYVIEEFKNEVNFSLKSHIRSEPITSESKTGYPLNTLQNSKYSGDIIKEESLGETLFLIHEEIDIKSDNEENDQSNIKPAEDECEKRQPISNKIAVTASRHRKDVPLHKCTLCPYESNLKQNLQRHIRCVHKPKGVEVFKCPEDSCLFKTYDKSYLGRHIKLIHKSNNIFKCLKCSYQSKNAGNFKVHILIHEDQSKWLSCTLCPYKTPRRNSLNQHALVHKSDSEVKWFYCSECSYKTRYKSHLNQHNLTYNQVLEK